MAALLRRRRSTVSVVVAVTDENASFLDDCLASLRAQERRPDTVVLAVSGSGADTRAFVAAAELTPDSAPLSRVDGDPDAALSLVSTTYVMVVAAGDLLAPGALRALTGSLDESASELALPGDVPRARATLESAPGAAASLDLASMLVRTSFWREVGLTAPLDPLVEWLTAAQAVVRAGSFDVVAGSVRRAGRRGTGLAFNARLDVAPHVGRVVPLVEALLQQLSAPALLRAREQLARRLLASEVSRYLEDAERCDPAGWQALAGLARQLVEALPAALLGSVPVEARTRCWLAAADRRPDLERFNTDRWNEGADYPTTVRDGRVLAVMPVADVPDEVLALSPDESPLVTQLRRARWLDDRHLELEVAAWTSRLGAGAGPARTSVSLVAESGEQLDLPVTELPGAEVNLLAGERDHDHSDGLLRCRVDTDRIVGPRPVRWSLHVDRERAGVRRTAVVRDVERRGSVAALARRRGVRLELDPASIVVGPGDEDAQPAARSPEVTTLALDGDVLVVSGQAPDGRHTLRVKGPGGASSTPVEVVGGSFETRLPLRHDPWGLGTTALPPGSYRLRLVGEDDDPVEGPGRLVLGTALAARTPYVDLTAAFRMRVERNPDGSAQLVLAPPLPEDQAGPFHQQQLRRWYASDEHRLDPGAVYLQSYAGTAATDSPLAIHHELRRSHPELRLLWAAADSSVTLPEGAERVQLRSRAWYDALATCGHVVTNTDLDEWFVKRPGQRLLQTFHGYPAKAMGVMAWEAKNHPRSLIEKQLRRTSATWDLLLTPHPAMDVHYREQYRYAGPIHNAGYPRDDVLVGPDADRLREETRRRLGIGDRTAVLYAPTWRDDLTTNFRAAHLPSTFDVEGAAAALGDEYVLLLRGHRFHRRRPDVRGRLLDVTGYPEVNHLLLAADAAVLDYSSLRFDFALTRRPMVFLVPDLDRYGTGVRGFLHDFRSSAPGPLVDTTEEVVSELRDLGSVSRRHQDDYERFHVQFNALQDGHAAERVVRAFFG